MFLGQMFDVIHQWIHLNDDELMESFFSNFDFVFKFFGQRQKFFQKIYEALIFIKLRCVIYQWIRLNEFYKLMKSFLQF